MSGPHLHVDASPIGGWEDLRLHVLLQVANTPQTGGGSILYLGLIHSGMAALEELGISAGAREWSDATAALHRQLISLKNGKLASPTSHDLADPIWNCIHQCIAIRDTTRKSTAYVDALLSLGIVHTIANKATIALSFLQGIFSLYKSSVNRKAHRDWYSLLGPNLLDKEALALMLPTLSNSPSQRFTVQTLAILASPLARIASLNQFANRPKEITSRPLVVSPTGAKPDPQEADEDDNRNLVEPDQSPEEEAKGEAHKFQAGDSILGWHATKASFVHRNERLGLQSWESLPPALTAQITIAMAAILSGDSHLQKPVASIALLSLLTSTPLHVLLHARLNAGSDFYIDIEQGCFCWSVLALLSHARTYMVANQNDLEPTSNETFFRIPLPELLARELQRQLSVHDGSVFLHQLHGIEPDTAEWEALTAAMRLLLKQLGDPAFPANPGRWCNSMVRVGLEAVGSDLMCAAICLGIQLTGTSPLHYFHPSGDDIADACRDAYKALGLGELSSTFNASLSLPINLPSDHELMQGFREMEQDMQFHFKRIRTRSAIEKRLESFNTLVKLTAASFVFFSAGRGSKIEHVRAGSVFLSGDLLHLDDKDVADERGSRLLPKTKYHRLVLERLGHAQCLVAGLISDSMNKNQGDSWRELSKGQYRFDAIAFQTIELSRGSYTKKPLKAKDIEIISQKYFARPKNFMRHVVITRWSTARLDRNLLRLVTGHASSGLQMPAVGSVYSPFSAIYSACHPLEQLLARWIPPPDPDVRLNFTAVFPELPGRRIHKNHRAHRDDLLQGIAGPRFDRWHLASSAIVTTVRKRLLHAGPTDPAANLWLHLLCFDGIHDEDDLTLIFFDLPHSLELGDKGWVYRFRREGNAQEHINLVQSPTSTLLHAHAAQLKADTSARYEEILSAASDWLGTNFPQFWGQSDSLKVPQALVLAANVRLWCDLCLPTSLQYAYEPKNHASMLDSSSASRVFGLPNSSGASAGEARIRSRNFNVSEQFEQLLRLVSEIGNNDKRLGELAARATLMTDRLSKLGDMAPNTWPDLVSRAVKRNIEMIRAGSQDYLEFSSLSTYVGYLKPNLTALSADLPGEFDELDWVAVSQYLRTVQSNSQQPTPERQQAQNDAANWLLKRVNESGVAVPAQAITNNHARVLLPSSSHPIGHLEESQVTSIRDVLHQWFSEEPLKSLRADLAIEMLSNAPLRWGELSCLAAQDISDRMHLVCIQPAGFSQIKSYLSTRVLPMPPIAKTLATNIQERLDASKQSVTSKQFLFLSKVDGIVNGTTAYWLHDAITTVMREFAGNEGARVHWFRARNISDLVFPGWRALLDEWVDGTIGPVGLALYFEYSASKAWRMESSRCAGGHSQDRTTIGFYLYPSFQLRSLAMVSTLTDLRPTAPIIEALSSMAAFKKQGTRVKAVRDDPWIFVQQHTPKRQGPKAGAPLIPAEPPESDHREFPVARDFHVGTADLQYAALRLAGFNSTEATDPIRSTVSRVNLLEGLIGSSLNSSSDLRKRVRGSEMGRARAADASTIQSDVGQTFAGLTFILKRTGCENLLALLTQKPCDQPWHEVLLGIESLFRNTPWAIESVCDLRFEDVAISVKLNSSGNLIASAPQRAVGVHPRVFICLKSPKNENRVVKSRLTVMARLLCQAYLLIKDLTEA